MSLNHIGEGSMKLAQNLGVNSNPKHGGINSNIVYILFTNSGILRIFYWMDKI